MVQIITSNNYLFGTERHLIRVYFCRKVTAAATAQMNTLWHTTNIYMHSKITEYAKRLTDKMPGDLKVSLTRPYPVVYLMKTSW